MARKKQLDKAHLNDIRKGIRKIHDRLNTGKAGKQIPGVKPIEAYSLRKRITGYTSDMIISIALNAGNLGNLRALEKGLGLTLKDVKTIMAELLPHELDLIQRMWDVNELLFADHDAVFFKQNGRNMKKIPPEPITIEYPDGTKHKLRGGYMHLKYDPVLSREVADFSEQDLLAEERRSLHRIQQARDHSSKDRTGSSYPPLLMPHVFFTNVSDVLQYTYFTGITNDIYKVIKTKKFRDAYTNVMGEERYDMLVPLLSRLNNPRATGRNDNAKWMSVLQGLVTMKALGMRTKATIKQTFSLTTAINQHGLPTIVDGLTYFLKNPAAAIKESFELAPAMEDRWKNIEIGMEGIMQNVFWKDKVLFKDKFFGKEWTVREIQELFIANIPLADSIASQTVFWGVLRKHMAKTNNREEAALIAVNEVAKSNPMTDYLWRNLWQVGGKDQNANMRLLAWSIMPFNTFTMLHASNTRLAVGALRAKKINKIEFLRSVGLERVIPPILGAMLAVAVSEDKDIEDLPKEVAYETLSWQAAGYPIVESLPRLVRYPGWAKVGQLPVGEPAVLAGKAIGHAIEGDWGNMCMDAIEMSEFFLKVKPVTGPRDLYKAGKALGELFE